MGFGEASALMWLITAAAAGPCSASKGAVVVLVKLDAGWQVGGDVREVDFLAARIHHQEQLLAAGIRNHQVVGVPPTSLVSSV